MKRKRELWPLVGPFFIIKANMLFSMNRREKELMWPLVGPFFSAAIVNSAYFDSI